MMTEIAALRAALPSLSARDAEFAQSLLDQAARRGLSDKQLFWVRKLAEPKAPAAPAKPKADLSAIAALFAKAGGSRPAITFGTDATNVVRLTVAGSQSRLPGTINVTSPERGWEGRTWFGRIDYDGHFEPSRKVEAQQTTAIEAALEAFARNPEEQARLYGFRTGTCCFCAAELTNETSMALGYGPVCAKRWGLPHNLKAISEKGGE